MLTLCFPQTTLPLWDPNNPQNGKGLWTNYEKAQEDNKLTLPFTAELLVEKFTDFHPIDIWRKLDLYFDPKYWDTSVYGLIYTDRVFEEAVATWWHDTIGFPKSYGTPIYTEQGMQGSNYISMELHSLEGDHPWWAGFSSAHEAMSLLSKNPDIERHIIS